MKVLVTGGAGFIGSNIVDLLLANDYEVVIVDDLSTGKKENINPNASFYDLDICDDELIDVFKKENPDYVVHEAAQINVRESINDPVFDAQINVLGSLNLLENCRKTGVKRIVYASSGGAIYGEPENLPADEKHTVRPLCPYGASKYSVEKYLDIYEQLHGLEHITLRYSNVYGPRQDPLGEAGVVAIFTNKLLNNEIPTIFGAGEQTRDFVYVGDVARANLMALKTQTNERFFNIGSGVETSVNELSTLLVKHTNASVRPVHGDEVTGEVNRIYLNIGLALEELDWAPEIDFADGLKKTVGWAKGE